MALGSVALHPTKDLLLDCGAMGVVTGRVRLDLRRGWRSLFALAVVGAFILVNAVAWFPARRAARIVPATILRAE